MFHHFLVYYCLVYERVNFSTYLFIQYVENIRDNNSRTTCVQWIQYSDWTVLRMRTVFRIQMFYDVRSHVSHCCKISYQDLNGNLIDLHLRYRGNRYNHRIPNLKKYSFHQNTEIGQHYSQNYLETNKYHYKLKTDEKHPRPCTIYILS
jgi:hypothetical protein